MRHPLTSIAAVGAFATGIVACLPACVPPRLPVVVTIVDGAPVPDMHHGDQLNIILIDGTVEAMAARCDWMGGMLVIRSAQVVECDAVDF